MAHFLAKKVLPIRQTKIICTIGPASKSPEIIEKLIKAGMDAARLNFSYGTNEEHRESLSNIRRASEKLRKPIAIIQDLCGPKIRIGEIAGGQIRLSDSDTVRFEKGEFISDKNRLCVSYKYFVHDVQPGARILLSDGAIELSAIKKDKRAITCKVIIGGVVKPHMGVNLPGTKISSPSLTPKDKKDLEWGIKNKVDYIALSFVRSASDIRLARETIHRMGGDVSLIAKIEKPEALKDIEKIIRLSDAVMVARGDLGVELPVEKVPFIQKTIIRLCHKNSKVVITATQMLQSMIEKATPTRAEVSDVANAIFDGTDGIMLSGETAAGKYPVSAALYMDKIADETEDYIKSDAGFHHEIVDPLFHPIANALSHGTAKISEVLDIKAVFAYTVSGATALFLSKRRLHLPIIAVSPRRRTINKMCLFWGVIPLFLKESKKRDEWRFFDCAEEYASQKGIIKKNDLVLLVAGAPPGKNMESNILRIKRI